MSRQRRCFSAKFKSDLVIEAIKGERTINEIASENNIQPNLLRNWKNEFLEKASVVFDEGRDENILLIRVSVSNVLAPVRAKHAHSQAHLDWLL